MSKELEPIWRTDEPPKDGRVFLAEFGELSKTKRIIYWDYVHWCDFKDHRYWFNENSARWAEVLFSTSNGRFVSLNENGKFISPLKSYPQYNINDDGVVHETIVNPNGQEIDRSYLGPINKSEE